MYLTFNHIQVNHEEQIKLIIVQLKDETTHSSIDLKIWKDARSLLGTIDVESTIIVRNVEVRHFQKMNEVDPKVSVDSTANTTIQEDTETREVKDTIEAMMG